MKSVLVAALLAASAVFAGVVHEQRGSLDTLSNANKVPVEPNAIIPIRIGLIQQNLHLGYDHLIKISHPQSKDYGKHWTAAEVEAEFAPSKQSVETVLEWLKEYGVRASRPANKGWIAFNAPTTIAEDMFETTFYEYSTGSNGPFVLGCDSYSLPEHLTAHVDYITPGVKPSPNMMRQKRSLQNASKSAKAASLTARTLSSLPTDLQNCSDAITPPCLRALYNISMPATNGSIQEGMLGIYENGAFYDQDDLNDYFTNFAPYVPNGTHPALVSVNGATAPSIEQEASSEAVIDFDVAYSILGASPISIYAVAPPANDTTANGQSLAPFLDAVDASFCSARARNNSYQCGGAPLTSVISFSYSVPELFGANYKFQQRACSEFMKLSLQGHTIVFASGDYGVAANPLFGEDLCQDNGCIPQNLNNTGYGSFNGTIFAPQFPANCPYVLSVGATMLESGQTVYDYESAMNIPKAGAADCDSHVSFSSGGGFANYFARPSYQDSAVQTYLNDYAPNYKYYTANAAGAENKSTTIGKNGGIYNRAGRGIPDVSANGAFYTYFFQGNEGPVDGTSLAAPLWASLIAMINQARSDDGKQPVGFINPTLYEHPEVFHDIVNGSNPGCGTAGFSAVKGWDPITGLGTPNYPALLDLFMSLP